MESQCNYLPFTLLPLLTNRREAVDYSSSTRAEKGTERCSPYSAIHYITKSVSRQSFLHYVYISLGGKEKRAENHLFSSSTQPLSLSPTKNFICIWCFQVNQLFSATVEQGYVHYKVVGNIKKWPTLFSILERLGSSSQLG